jgi:hypothetical protein
VFLLYIYFISSDDFVNQVIQFKKILSGVNHNFISNEWIKKNHPDLTENFRQLLIASGEYELLEKMDMDTYMLKIN